LYWIPGNGVLLNQRCAIKQVQRWFGGGGGGGAGAGAGAVVVVVVVVVVA
jgi:hypothetical protein